MKRVSAIASFLLVLAALAAASLTPAVATAVPGELDPSFGTGGSLRILPSQEDIAMNGVAVQPDGRVVLAGYDRTTGSVLVVRLLENGGFDPSFGEGGVVDTVVPGASEAWAEAVAVQPDGKIVIAGAANVGPDTHFLAARYEADGAPDPSFGEGGGIELYPVVSGEGRFEAVKIGAGGRVLLAGELRLPLPSGSFAAVVVLTPEGKPDTSFSPSGGTFMQIGSDRSDQATGITEQPDGKILVADENGNGRGDGFTIVRLLPNSKFDPEFGTEGVVTTPIPGEEGGSGRSTDVAVQPDGRIVAAGYGFDEVGPEGEKTTDEKFAAVRYLPNGQLDSSFGGSGTGIFSKQAAGTLDDQARWIGLAPNGGVLLGGLYEPTPSNSSLALLRLDDSGVLDPTFGVGGMALRGVTAPFGDSFQDAGLDSSGRVVMVSTAFEAGEQTSVEVSRYLGDPQVQSPPPGPPTRIGPPPVKPAPHARMKAVPRKLAASRLKGFSGTAGDPGGKLAKVQIALVKAATAKAGRAATCQELKNARGRFKTVKVKRGTCPLRWLNATGKAKWRFKLKAELPAGRYVVYARAVDASGLAESTFSRGAGNRYGFRIH